MRAAGLLILGAASALLLAWIAVELGWRLAGLPMV